MASIRRTTRCQLMAHLLIKTWYRRIGRSKLNTSEANYYQEQLRNGIPAEAGPNETSRLLGTTHHASCSATKAFCPSTLEQREPVPNGEYAKSPPPKLMF